MLCHGVIFYILIIKAEVKERLKPKMKWFYALGWGKKKKKRISLKYELAMCTVCFSPFLFVPGFPLPMVAVPLVVTGTKTYAASNCWLTLEHGIIYWAFVAPVTIVIFVSKLCIIFVLSLQFVTSSICYY